MLRAVINNVDYNISSGELNWELDAVSECNFEILASEIDWKNSLYFPVKVIYKDITLFSGYIDKTPTLNIDGNDTIMVSLDCVDDLGRIACRRSYRRSHYQNQTLLFVLTDLMSSISGWELDISQLSLTSQNELITIDLRSKESLFAQLVDAIRTVPTVHLRYGGINPTTGNYILSIGEFNTVNVYAEKGFNVGNISVESQNNRVYYEVESYSGLSGNGKVRLNRALTDARYLSSPYNVDYPIILDPTDNAYVVQNLNANNNVSCSTRKSFEAIKTKNDVAPTAGELDDVSWTLYLKTVRFLKETDLSNLYTLDVSLPNLPNVGDRIRINAIIEEPIFDRFSGQIMGYNKTLEVHEDFRITRFSLDVSTIILNQSPIYNTQDEFMFNIVCSDNDELGYYDESIELYNELEKYESIND